MNSAQMAGAGPNQWPKDPATLKQEWKEKLADVLLSEPGISQTPIPASVLKLELIDYLNQLELISDSYYGVTHEIICGIEKHLNL